MTIDPTVVRSEFPSLATGAVFLDNPGGTQVPHAVVERMRDYLLRTNANQGGAFPTSQASDAVIDETRQGVADFINAARREEVVFGANMTTLTFGLSRAIAKDLKPGDEIIVTRLDHDANITPWSLVAEERGCTLRWLDFEVEDCTLRVEALENLLRSRTRLVAVGYASNAVGTLNPIAQIVERAHQVGARCFVDAVHYAPHGPIDVQDLGCDFLALSAYKFFGPHVGVLYGKYEHLERLRPAKVRPASDDPPEKFETGTLNIEGLAGTLAALTYLKRLGEHFGVEHAERYAADFSGRRLLLKQAMTAVRAREMELSRSLIETLSAIPGLKIYGITDLKRLDRRVPTVSFTLGGMRPRPVAEALARAGVYAWDGNHYALSVTERLGLGGSGGTVRVGAVHYNTLEEVERLGEVLREIVAQVKKG